MEHRNDWLVDFGGLVIVHQKIPGHEVGRHSHREHEFFFPLQGHIIVQDQDKIIKAGPGRMLYVPPNREHSFSSTAEGAGERVILLIKDSLWKKQIKTKYSPMGTPANGLAKELLFYLLIHKKISGVKYFISALIEALGETLKATKDSATNISMENLVAKISEPGLLKAIEMIQNGESSIEKIAKGSAMSLRNFNRLFVKEIGLNPKDFIIRQKIETAKGLLLETNMTVTDVALEVGYNSLSKFITTFKRLEGRLPSDFRKSD